MTDLGASVATTDIIPVVDSTDTTTKRTTIANILALGPSTVSITSNEVPSGTVNSSNVDFTTAAGYVSGSLQVYINGLRQALTTHFTETTPASGTFAMGDAPTTGDIITVSYQTAASATGNADTIDNIHANTTATANQLMPLDASAKLPNTILASPVTRFVAMEGVKVVNGVDPANTNWTAVDVTANTSATTYAVMLALRCAAATAFRSLFIRPTGSATAQADGNAALRVPVASASASTGTYVVGVNASQSFDYSVDNADVSSVSISVIGYWETVT